jgi:hypothetical protein
MRARLKPRQTGFEVRGAGKSAVSERFVASTRRLLSLTANCVIPLKSVRPDACVLSQFGDCEIRMLEVLPQ